MSVVIDASAVAAWAFSDERSVNSIGLLRRVGEHGALVPSIWPHEVANMLVQGERRGRLARNERDAFLARLARLPIRVEVVQLKEVVEGAVAMADAHGLTVYDAAYLDLAARSSLPLATKDELLVAAAAKVGVTVLPA